MLFTPPEARWANRPDDRITAGMDAPWSMYLGAAWDQGINDSLWGVFDRALDDMSMSRGQLLPPEELNEKYGGLPGLRWDKPEGEDYARRIYNRKRDELRREALLTDERWSLGRTAASMGVGMIANNMNPLDLSLNFFPVVGTEVKAAAVMRAGGGKFRQLLARGLIPEEHFAKIPGKHFFIGSVEGTVGNMVAEIPLFIQSKMEQANYTISDSVVNVALGGLFGGALQQGLSGAARLWRHLSPTTKEAMMRQAIDNALNDKAQTRLHEMAATSREAVQFKTKWGLSSVRNRVNEWLEERLPKIKEDIKTKMAAAGEVADDMDQWKPRIQADMLMQEGLSLEGAKRIVGEEIGAIEEEVNALFLKKFPNTAKAFQTDKGFKRVKYEAVYTGSKEGGKPIWSISATDVGPEGKSVTTTLVHYTVSKDDAKRIAKDLNTKLEKFKDLPWKDPRELEAEKDAMIERIENIMAMDDDEFKSALDLKTRAFDEEFFSRPDVQAAVRMEQNKAKHFWFQENRAEYEQGKAAIESKIKTFTKEEAEEINNMIKQGQLDAQAHAEELKHIWENPEEAQKALQEDIAALDEDVPDLTAEEKAYVDSEENLDLSEEDAQTVVDAGIKCVAEQASGVDPIKQSTAKFSATEDEELI